MFERFTANARGVAVRAQEEARTFQHGYIGTEHLLLALLDSPGIGATALRKLGITQVMVRADIEAEVGFGKAASSGHIPFTKRAKKVLELSLRESLQFGHNYIGTEHILLALEREGEGLGAKILAKHISDMSAIRTTARELIDTLTHERAGTETTRRTIAATEAVSNAEVLAGAAPVGSHHLLEALVRAEGSMAAKVLRDLGVDPAAIAAKVDEIDTEDTTDASPEEVGARKMELRVVDDEVHLVFRDHTVVDLAKEVTDQLGGPVRSTGPVTGKFVPLWTATNEVLGMVRDSLSDYPEGDETGSKAALLVRRVLHDRLRRRDNPGA